MRSLISISAVLAFGAASPSSPSNIYLDVRSANTTEHLETIRQLPVSTYRLSYDADRLRIGVLGPDAAAIIPDAVDIIPKQTIPPREKGGKRIVLHDVPVVNEKSIFMRSVGATQELFSLLESLETALDGQIDHVSNLFADVEQLEQVMASSTDGEEEMRMRAAAAEAKIAQAEMELELQRAKDEEEYIRAASEAEAEQIRRAEELTIQRLAREDEAARIRAEEAMTMKLEASQKVEQTKAETAEALSAIEHERALLVQRASEAAKVKTAEAIAAAKAQAERDNEGLYLRRLKAQMEQSRQRHLAIVHAVARHLAASLSWAVQHPRQVFVLVGYLTLIFAAIYTAREAARLCRILIEASIGKPSLVRETTCKSFPRSILSSIVGWRRKAGDEEVANVFQDVVLSEPLKDRVVALAKSARNAKRHDAPYRHILLYGPPGCGKTMVAKKLAECTGLDYALMSGGDIGPLGNDAVTQIHNLFRWAKMSRKGLLLFIDEAEAFLGNRKHCKMSENAHNALNALLYNTGGERRDFMLVLATNRAEDLDAAVLDRCDESLLFSLPDSDCRKKLISQYFDSFVKDEAAKNDAAAESLGVHVRSYLTKEAPFRIRVDEGVMDGQQLQATVDATKGFSGREIGKLMVAMQATLYSSDEGRLSKEMVQSVVVTKTDEHRDKRLMIGDNVFSDKDSGSDTDVHETAEEEELSVDEDEALLASEARGCYEEKTPPPSVARQYGRRTLARAAAAVPPARNLFS